MKRVVILLFINTYLLLLDFTFGEERVLERIKGEKKKLEKVKDEIEAENRRLKDITWKKKDILRRLSILERDLEIQRRNLQSLNVELGNLQKRIRAIKEEITILSKDLAIKKRLLAERVTVIYRLRGLDPIEVLSSSSSFPDSTRKFRFMRLIALQNATLIREIEDKKRRLLEKESILKAEYERVEELKNRQSSLYKREKAKKVEKEKLLADLNQNEVAYRRKITELRKAASRLEGLIKELEAKKRRVEGGLRTKVSWPVTSREILTNFGRETKFGVESINKGIDISCNGPVMAVSQGKVVYTGRLKGYGNLVIIDHGGSFYSVYGGLSCIRVEVGREVDSSTLIGEVEGTLHFEIRIDGEAVNPLDWLR